MKKGRLLRRHEMVFTMTLFNRKERKGFAKGAGGVVDEVNAGSAFIVTVTFVRVALSQPA